MINAENETTRADAAPHDAIDPKRPVRMQVATIMDGGREAILEHAGQDYRLRITNNGKLILTK